VRRILARHTLDYLPDADELDFRRIAELLAALEMWPTLRELVRQAAAHWDADKQEVGRDVVEAYGPMLEAR
jgi:hypothetical protein